MKKRSVIYLLPFLILSACSTTQKDFRDENILLNFPIPESGWMYYSGRKNGDDNMIWTKECEWFCVSILHGRGRQTPQQFRTGMDNEAQKHLTKDFESSVLNDGFINNYPMILWQTSATLNSGTKTFNLFLYIEGNDASYLVNRRWLNSDVPQPTKETWIKYLSSINVCDTRSPDHPCPIKEGTRPARYPDMTNAVPK